MQKNNLQSKTHIEISESALGNNLRVFRRLAGKNKIYCVVKANAYGHGLYETVTLLEKLNADMYAVDNLSEALRIREMGVEKPVLILGYTPLSNIKDAIDNNISFTIYSHEAVERIRKIDSKKNAKVHLKLETGLNRQGLMLPDALELARLIHKNNKNTILEGVSTHFTDIEDTSDPFYSTHQLNNFNKIVEKMSELGIRPKFRHIACSAAAILYPQTHMDALRIGISLYGLWPSKETKASSKTKMKQNINLKPVLSWKSIVAQVKLVNKGESVSYGRTWYAARNSKIAIIPVGYSDGFDRGLSNIGRVIIGDSYAPVVGRVAMNMVMVDVTDVENVNAEDEVILIGKSNHCSVTADEIAQKIGTINYEVVSRINPLVPKIFAK